MDLKKPNAVLRGGPELSQEQRIRSRPDDRIPEVVKIFRGNRHDHFRPTGAKRVEPDGELHVFEWSHSTYAAE